jgi:hypothetical protein
MKLMWCRCYFGAFRHFSLLLPPAIKSKHNRMPNRQTCNWGVRFGIVHSECRFCPPAFPMGLQLQAPEVWKGTDSFPLREVNTNHSSLPMHDQRLTLSATHFTHPSALSGALTAVIPKTWPTAVNVIHKTTAVANQWLFAGRRSS